MIPYKGTWEQTKKMKRVTAVQRTFCLKGIYENARERALIRTAFSQREQRPVGGKGIQGWVCMGRYECRVETPWVHKILPTPYRRVIRPSTIPSVLSTVVISPIVP